MKKFYSILLLTLFTATAILAQSPSSGYFEVYTKPVHARSGGGFTLNKDSLLARINSVSDTVSTQATFVVTVENVSLVDSVFFTLTNSQNQEVYIASLSYASLTSNSNFRVSGNTLYFTVGPYSYIKQFSATARLKYTSGSLSTIRSFSKN